MVSAFPAGERRIRALSTARHYRAFISYSHEDSRAAIRLHRSLEGYRVPERLRSVPGEFGPVPERLSPIFCDREDLASSADLGERVRGALADSEALIVVCSPAAARSRWVNEEILAFRQRGDGRRVFSLIVSGEPNAGDERECFPPALRGVGVPRDRNGRPPAEPIAADMRQGKDGPKRARLKLIAGLLGIGFDALRQREAQRRQRKLIAIAVASLAGMTLALVLAATAWIERNNALRQQALAEIATQNAQRRQTQAESLLGFLFDELRPKLEKVGRLDLLETIDDNAEKYFASLPPGDFNDGTLARQEQMLTSIGQVRLSQARFHEALDSFQNAYVRSSELADRHPRDGARLFDRGQAEYWIGYVHWQSRDLDQAQIWLTHYRDTSHEVYALDPSNLDWEHELGYGDHNLAALELDRGLLESAAAGFERARKTFESMLARNPDDAQFAFDVADEISWQGKVEEQLGHLAQATELLADRSERLRAISAKNPNEPKWKVEWSTAQVMQSDLLRVRGRFDEALAVANEAVERLKPLTALDPSNKEWSQDYLYALLMRAAAQVGTGKPAAARADLVSAQPLLDSFAGAQTQDRHVRRDLLDAGTLRILVALQGGDLGAARSASDSLHLLSDAEPTSAEDAGRYALSQVAAGMAAVAAGRASDAEVYFSAGRRVLEPLAHASRYWRVLDPWLRLAQLAGDVPEGERVKAQLSEYGYVTLFPWPAAKTASSHPADVRAKSSSRIADAKAEASVNDQAAASRRANGRARLPPIGAASIQSNVVSATPPPRLQP